MKIHNNNFRYIEIKLLLILIISLFIGNVFIGILTPTVSASPPSAPPLKSPDNNAFLNDTQPNLEWYPSNDAENDSLRYEIQVDEFNDNWASLVTNYTTGYFDTSWQIPSPLLDGKYQWRVQADDGKSLPNSTSTWSSVWYFTIDTEPPLIIDGSGDFSTYTGKPFTIYTNYTDNTSSVSISTIYYKKLSDPTYKAQIMLETALNKFYITNQLLGIDTSYDKDDYVYHIIAQDKAGNKFKYSNSGDTDFLITVLDDVPPEIISGTGEMTATTDDEFSIYIDSTDNIDVTEATLFIRKIEYAWHYLKLNEFLSKGRFIINYSELKSQLGFNTSDGTNCEYYILVFDSSNNIQNYSNSSNIPWKIEVIDNDGPKAIHGSGDLIVTTDDPFTVFTNFTDNIKVTEAKIFIKKTGDPDNIWFSSNMKEISMNNFSKDYEDLKLHPQLQMDTSTGYNYEYYILAYDSANNFYNYTCTIDDCWDIQVMDNDPPTLMDGSGDFMVSSDDPFTIYANFTDNIDVADAQIFIRNVDSLVSGDTQKSSEMNWLQTWMIKNVENTIGDYTISYDILKSDLNITTKTGGSLEYFIIARDSAGNKYNYSPVRNDFWEIFILDNDPPVILNFSGNFSVMTGEDFTIYVDLYDNTEINSVLIYYNLIESGKESQSNSWLALTMLESSSSLNPEANYNDLEIHRFVVTNIDLDLETTNNNIINYYLLAYDYEENIESYGTPFNPYQITIVDNFPPSIEIWSSEPENLRADYDEDFVIKVIITDSGGSGLDNQSVMIRFQRGSYYSIFHDYTNMDRVLSYGTLTSNLKTEWQFAIPKPIIDEHNNINKKIRYSWELIAGEYLNYEIQCSDNQGNIFRSGIHSEYIDPTSINHYPVIDLISPVGNENLSGKEIIQWLATDFDNDELLITINISTDNGESWSVLVPALPNDGTYVWDTTKYQNGDKYLIKIFASDSELRVHDVTEDSIIIYNVDTKSITDKPSDNNSPSYSDYF
jgi:hypothetical protein